MTVWPPLVLTGLLMLTVTTSTDIPGSIMMPLVFFLFFVVILNLAIGSVIMFSQIYPLFGRVKGKGEGQNDAFLVFLLSFCAIVQNRSRLRKGNALFVVALCHHGCLSSVCLCTVLVDGHRKSESAVLLVHLLSGIAKHLSRNEFEEQTLTLMKYNGYNWVYYSMPLIIRLGASIAFLLLGLKLAISITRIERFTLIWSNG